MTDKNNSNQDELDVYQAAWVIGKQRGEEMPLTKEQLGELLEAGRLEWGWLTESERSLVGVKKSNEKSKEIKNETDKKIMLAKSVVVVLLDELRKLAIMDSGEDEWNGMSKQAQRDTLLLMFNLEYGVGPSTYAKRLVDIAIMKGNQNVCL